MKKRTLILFAMAYFFVLATMNAVSCSPNHTVVAGSKTTSALDGLIFSTTLIEPAERIPESRLVNNDSDVPAPPYIIKVRVIVEKDKDGNLARTPEQIAEDLDIASQFFEKIHMTFSVIEAEVVPIELNGMPSNRDYRNDAFMHNDTMSIYYVFGHEWLMPTGLSTFPWDEDRFGIFMNGKYAGKFTLAHEIGHYFGLYHTFDEGDIKGDFVLDTLDEDEWNENNGEYKTYNNLMNYSSGNERHLTMGQLERVRYYLITYRLSHLLVRSADIGTIEIAVDVPDNISEPIGPVSFPQDD